MPEIVRCRSCNCSVNVPFGIWEEHDAKRLGIDPDICPHCGKALAGPFGVQIFDLGCFIIFGIIVLGVIWGISKLF
jgi:hypothetical protein